ncbi:Nucleotide-binding alpha-beta plait [Penicillium bovifimosum]|uniref:Nucleotide-binding alpha-beta plait n=1 Tax=Penicillium bovifimosum TaxID=126998 RepID=A0A9W9HBP0_9EURO|nr:Nucleotide-binding alpha-beta plait [Penicillium bovifimosum]KAJ5143524.1 Nucleotide-binding alpha-beta plait [Penicillium bovifimosum]
MAWPFNAAVNSSEGEYALLQSSSIEDLLHPSSIPFGSTTDTQIPSRMGVLVISNIPYTLTRHEVTSFLGRSARILPSSHGCPVHILMERSTGKTMDCYVEFSTERQAKETVDRLSRAYDSGSAPRMGSRHVDIEMSSPAKLLKAIFPLAKCISWETGSPVQLENNYEWSTGFNGFLTDEELFCLTRHAEQPHRSVFACKVPQRCYESFITTIWKFPWRATHLYTVHHRNALFLTLCKLIRILVASIKRNRTIGLDSRLLTELVQAGIECPGFNPRMKYCFAWYSEDQQAIMSLDHDWCLYFPYDTMTYLPGHTIATMQFYAFLMNRGSVLRTEAEGLVNEHHDPRLERIFGRFWFDWQGDAARQMVFKDAIIYEAAVLRKFIITGFQHLRRRTSSASTIGTAPYSSPNPSEVSAPDSERTISVTQNISVDPSPAFQQTSNLATIDEFTSRFYIPGQDTNVPSGTTRVGSQGDITNELPVTPTRSPPVAAERYRAPHARTVSVTRTARDHGMQGNWRMPHSQEQPRPGYYVPHSTTDYKLRSSSDPFAPAPLPPRTWPSKRSRSDCISNMFGLLEEAEP